MFLVYGVHPHIRELYEESGAILSAGPEVWGLNPFLKSQKGLEIVFDYGVPKRLYTPDGCYVIIEGLTIKGNWVSVAERFLELLSREFEVEIIKPRRNDEELFKTPEGRSKYRLEYSGPLVRIKESG